MKRAYTVVGLLGVVTALVASASCEKVLVPCYVDTEKEGVDPVLRERRNERMDGTWELKFVDNKPFVFGQPVPNTLGSIIARSGSADFHTTYVYFADDCSKPVFSRGYIDINVSYTKGGTVQYSSYMATYELDHKSKALTISVPTKKGEEKGNATVTFSDDTPIRFDGTVKVKKWGAEIEYKLTFQRSFLQ